MTWGGLGATHWDWDPDVQRIVDLVERRFPGVRCNSYVGHPARWDTPPSRAWSRRSFDVWGAQGRGDSIRLERARAIREFLMDLPGDPWIRHTILEHALWTSFGGYSHWTPNDHSGSLRHLHVTYW